MTLTRLLAWLAAILAAAILVAIATWHATRPANAEDRGAFFKGLKQPDTGISCCDISDCKVTKAYEMRGDQWWSLAETLQHGAIWVPIPPNKVLAPRARPAGIDPDEAILCSGVSGGVVFCFLAPDQSF